MSRTGILVTGGAGFIGSHVVDLLLQTGLHEVYCVDNFDTFYDPAVKLNNLQKASRHPLFHFTELDLCQSTPSILLNSFRDVKIEAIIHLAARAGVRPSIENPVLYYEINVKATIHLLEYARLAGIRQFLFASSSSVYGTNPQVPWKESDPVHEPISPYAASKIAVEEMGKVYSHLYGMHFIALRLFTVYGPRQRPDLAIHQFYNQIKAGQPITLFGDGTTRRDYTYVSDIAAGILAALHYNGKGYSVFNLGNHRQVELLVMIHLLETAMHTRARIRWQLEQPGDVTQTYADISRAAELLNYHPEVDFETGIKSFVEWKEKVPLSVPVN